MGTLRAMRRQRHDKPLLLTEDERRTLDQWVRRPKTAQRLALRSRVVLGCAEGLTNRAVATRLHVSSNCVCKWRERFRVRRLDGLTDEPRPGAPRKATDDRIVELITRQRCKALRHNCGTSEIAAIRARTSSLRFVSCVEVASRVAGQSRWRSRLRW